MAGGVSTANGTVMAILKANVSGNVKQIPSVTVNGARVRSFVETITLAAQASGAKIAVARLPVLAAILEITVLSDTGLGTATLKFGDQNDDAKFGVAATPTVNVPATFAVPATYGVPIVTGYDSDTGRTDRGWEDVIMTTAAAALPASGTMRVVTKFILD